MVILMEIGELIDFPCDETPAYWVNVLVFCLAIIAVIFMMRSLRPTLVRTEDPNSVEVQVDERKK